MTVTSFVRRWSLLILGAALLAWGLAVFLTQSTISVTWISYDLASGTALFPGAPDVQFGNADALHPHQVRRLSLSGQLAIGLGIALVAGWIGFALGKRRVESVPADGIESGSRTGDLDLGMSIPDSYREEAH